jgi:hypothetical protein
VAEFTRLRTALISGVGRVDDTKNAAALDKMQMGGWEA